MQPIDSSLVPLAVALERGNASKLYDSISSALEALAALLLASSSGPGQLRRSASKPTRSLSVFDKSLLASYDKIKLEEDESILLALFPLFVSLGRLVSELAGVALDSVSSEEREVSFPSGISSFFVLLAHSFVHSKALSRSVKSIEALALELEAVSDSQDLDVSTVHHVVEWVEHALQQLPQSFEHLTVDAGRQLAPLRTSLTLTSGKAMSAIWKASLPYKPNNESLAAAYARLKERGSDRNQVWTKGAFPLSRLAIEVSN